MIISMENEPKLSIIKYTIWIFICTCYLLNDKIRPLVNKYTGLPQKRSSH